MNPAGIQLPRECDIYQIQSTKRHTRTPKPNELSKNISPQFIHDNIRDRFLLLKIIKISYSMFNYTNDVQRTHITAIPHARTISIITLIKKRLKNK